MPKFDDKSQSLQQHKAGHFGFSAVKLDQLQSSEYTLVTLVADVSGSTSPFQKGMEDCIKNVVQACRKSPRADSLMLRVVLFDDNNRELHGFKPLNDINEADYDGALAPGGLTALYDAAIDGVEATAAFGRKLLEEDYAVNGIVIVITDGCENRSKFVYNDPNNSAKYVKDALTKAVTGECLESLVSILVAVNAKDASHELQKFNSEAGFTQFVDIGDATAGKLAKLAQFVSKSISSQSQALGTGGGSKQVTF